MRLSPLLAFTSILSSPVLLALPALAEVPKVAADIAPVHSLVAQVMQGVGTPELILPPGASPHGYAMRPSEAASLAEADLVVWMGHDLVPWLEKPLETIASQAVQLELLTLPGTRRLALRDTPVFDGKTDHEDHEDHEDHGGHDHDAQEHDDHDHEEEAHDDHDDHGHDHRPGGSDPHAWLDPENADLWLTRIAETLAHLDPEHAATYQRNADQARAELTALEGELRAQLAPVQSTPFVVFHDAYQYFESHFGLAAAGAISLGDASRPSPARLIALQEAVRENGIRCALAEPQFDPGLFATVFDSSGVEVRVIDPLGTSLTPGPALYGDLLRDMGKSLAGCLP
ncbi:zinc ABC transporter substrate-binding protein [Aliiroseovarius sp. xm-g-7]|uniref:zinc ABC transporter substrate-binding protein n=1 Tax=Aliiroseovarius sp. xm-g-7 TaxID=2651826 RepID=UPI001568D1B2|nr:zinc ABC transporter substrate-binding protein [Aliiroseovarius sp. xm-g-7]NRQ24616.1 High-affinity zinc uptake system protein ZnuA [Aliiroseovarius sp. xm-g-7]